MLLIIKMVAYTREQVVHAWKQRRKGNKKTCEIIMKKYIQSQSVLDELRNVLSTSLLQ